MPFGMIPIIDIGYIDWLAIVIICGPDSGLAS